ncbi:protein-tyrosine-phosphatase [Marinobacter sp. 3-2]|uniref:arsenate-mycothiol transferase ArsC n=1 Tax=Marinobacter sp. 3-2 TaxID=2485141 RepID=UPI000DD22FA4|nr:low molecular weight phosphatase family protein [Marinobacter sp. 3-2]ROQ42904.1 protein-tyrosine-phosphatase [Marinobacter sp. 3-2]
MDRLVYERFGSRIGFVRYLKYWLLAKIGSFRKHTLGQPDKNRRLVFICNGNICRSPVAEAYAKSLGREAASCGFGCADGFPADNRAIQFAESLGLSLHRHKTRNIVNFEFYDSDFIVVMEPSHLKLFYEHFERNQSVVLAGNYCINPNPYIHDPYNCCDPFFYRCECRVVEAVRGICG